jgi:hypothetical protein
MRATMCKLWTNFAKYGDPTPDENNPLPFKWNPVKAATEDAKSINLEYLKIDQSSTMMQNMYKRRVDFWRRIYEKYNSSFLNPKF